jgi:hypothetical protein
VQHTTATPAESPAATRVVAALAAAVHTALALTWDVVQHMWLLRCKLHRPLRLLRVWHKPNCSLIAQLQVLLGPPVHCPAVGEAQLPEDPQGRGVGRDCGALDVLDVVMRAAVGAGGGLGAEQTRK